MGKLYKTVLGTIIIFIWAFVFDRVATVLMPGNELFELLSALAGASLGAFLAWGIEYITDKLRKK